MSQSALVYFRFLLSQRVNTSNIYLFNENRKEIETYLNNKNLQIEVFMSVYSLRVNDSVVINDVMMNNGGVYTVMVDRIRDGYVSMLSLFQVHTVFRTYQSRAERIGEPIVDFPIKTS